MGANATCQDALRLFKEDTGDVVGHAHILTASQVVANPDRQRVIDVAQATRSSPDAPITLNVLFRQVWCTWLDARRTDHSSAAT